MAATPWLPWSALKIEVCFLIMQISNNPVEGGWGSVKRSSSRPTTHPSNAVVTAPQGPRQLRQTLASKHQASVALFLRNGVIPPDSLGTVKVDLHTAAVAEAIIGMDAKPNRVLGARPPPVDSSVTDLPRHWRSTLSQLRSGFCRCLRSYRAVVDQSGPSSCPECDAAEHTIEHLFQCASFPTTLYRLDLWINPLHAAYFLSHLPSFSHLPSLSPPSSPLKPHPVLTRDVRYRTVLYQKNDTGRIEKIDT